MDFHSITSAGSPKLPPRTSAQEKDNNLEQVVTNEELSFLTAAQASNFTSYNREATSSSSEEDELFVFELPLESDSQTTESPSALDQLPWHSIIETALKNKNLTSDLRVTAQAHVPIVPTPIIKIQKKVRAAQFLKQSESRNAFKQEAARYFKAALERTIEELEFKKTSEQATALRERGYAALDTILQRFDTSSSNISTSTLIQEVHCDMLQSLVLLKEDFFSPSSHPPIQVVPAEGDSWSVIRPAPLIENIAFSGGGARGVGYVPVLTALEKAGLLRNLQRVAGTSVGAIISAALACGLDTATLASIANIPLSQALSTPQETTSTQTMSPMGVFEGGYIPNLLHQEISRSVKTFFESNSGSLEAISNMQIQGTITAEEAQHLINFRTSIITTLPTATTESATRKSPTEFSCQQMTFKDLAILHKIDPTRFKKLTITGFNITAKKGEYYNAQTTPEMPIVDAVRISMSLPIIFCPPVNAKGESYTDGTLTSPIPAELFSQHEKSKTLLLGFSKSGSLNYNLHARGGVAAPLGAHFADVVTAPLYGTKLSKKTKGAAEAFYEAGPNTLQVEHGNLTAVSFFATPAEIKAVQLQAEVRTWEWIAARQHQAVHTVYESLEQALSFLSSQELRELIQYYRAPERRRILPLAQAEVLYTAQQILEEIEHF